MICTKCSGIDNTKYNLVLKYLEYVNNENMDT